MLWGGDGCTGRKIGGGGFTLSPEHGDISTKLTPLCSSYFSPSNKQDSTSLASFLAKSAYLAMLFIVRLMYTASIVSAENQHNEITHF